MEIEKQSIVFKSQKKIIQFYEFRYLKKYCNNSLKRLLLIISG